MKKNWTLEELQLLRINYPILIPSDLMKLFPDKTYCGIRSKAKVLNLLKQKQKFHFSDDILKELIKIYPNNSNSDIASKFGCSIFSINGKAWQLGLKKDPKYILTKNRTLGKELGALGLGNVFKNGRIPANKGKKITEFMTPQQQEVFKRNQFRKGTRPRNWLPVGSEVITDEGYVMVKLAEGMFNWEMKQRVTWELHKG